MLNPLRSPRENSVDHINNKSTTSQGTSKIIKPSSLSKTILKGKLFGYMNKINSMTKEQYNEKKLLLNLFHLEKYTTNKKKINKKFYYAQKSPNIITYIKSPSKFEDDYISAKDLLKEKFSESERKIILSYPEFFKLNKNEYLKDLIVEKHKHLYEILGGEEKNEEFNGKTTRQNSSLISLKTVKGKNKSRNLEHLNFRSSVFTSSRTNIKNKIFKTYENSHYMVNNKVFGKILEDKIKQKYESVKRRKYLNFLKNKKKFDSIREKGAIDQEKKEKERMKLFQEKQYIDYLTTNLKKNYNITHRLIEGLKMEEKEK